MSPLVAGILIAVCLLVCMFTGLQIAFAAGFVGLLFAILVMGPSAVQMAILSVWNTMSSFVLIACPLYVFMSEMMANSGVANDLYNVFDLWVGRVRGGIAIATVMVCVVFAACVGIIAGAIVAMCLIALPSMIKLKYDQSLAMGVIMAGGSLGILIPPSVLLIIYGLTTGESIGRLYMGAIMPGLVLATLYILYIVIRSKMQPNFAPPPTKERPSFKVMLSASKGILLPAIIIFMALGTIFIGWATASEAAAMGCIGALVASAIKGHLKWHFVKEAAYKTARITAMAMWIVIGAGLFSQVIAASGSIKLINDALVEMQANPWLVMIIIQGILFILGMFLDNIMIVMLTAVAFSTIATSLGFDPIWFAIVFNVNLQMAFLTPPFGYALFLMRALGPEGVTMRDVWRGAWMFVPIQAIGLFIVMFVPQIILWLPNLLFGQS